MNRIGKMDFYLLGVVIGISMVFPVSGALPIERMASQDIINSRDAFSANNTTTYVANNSVQQLFYVLGGVLKNRLLSVQKLLKNVFQIILI